MKGRKPLPAKTHILQGTFGTRQKKRARTEPKPEIVTEVPRPPIGLGKHGRILWLSIAKELVEKGILTVLDLATLEMLCANWQVYKECSEAIYRTGKRRRSLAQYMAPLTQQTALELSTMRAAFGTFKSLMAEFGLSPSSRMRLHVAPPKEPKKDRMEELIGEA